MTRKDVLAFTFLSLAWGSSFFWVKIALDEIGPVTMVASRMVLGAAGLAAIAYLRKPERPPSRSEWWILFWVAVTDVSLPLVLTTWGQQFIDSGVASILLSTVPLFTVILAYFFLHAERGSWWQWLGILIGFGGVFVLLSRDLGSNPQGSLWGYLSHLLGAALYAISGIIVRRRLSKTPLIYQSLITVLLADLMIWPLALAIESPIQLPSTTLVWVALVWLGLIASCFATVVYFYLLHSIGPTRASMITYAFPVVGVALGVLLLNEPFDLQLVLGSALVLGSITVVNRV